MKKTHTTFQTLVANTFNAHDETGDGLLWLGPVLFDGAIVTIGGYRARYNGIIVEDLALITHDTTGYKYVCLTGIDASPSSTPYTLVTNTKQGICLIESYKNGWVTKGKIFNNDYRGLPFYREADATGVYYYACYGPGVCADGTVVHTPIKIPMAIDVAAGTTGIAGVSDMFYNDATVGYGVVDGHYCNQHLAMFNDTVGGDIWIQNDALGVTQTVIGANGTSLACIEADANGCVYAYTVADHLFVGTCDYVAGPAAPIDYTLPSAIARIDFVTTTTMVIELADSTFIHGRLMPTVVDTLSSGSSRWFHVDHANGDFIHIGTDDKLYKNFVHIGTCTSRAFIIDQKIIQLTAGGQIINGTKSTGTGYSVTSVVANRTPADELFFLFVNGTGVDAVSYDPIHAEVTYSAHISNTAVLAAIAFGQNISYFYLDGDQITFEQPVSVGRLTGVPDVEIVPSLDNHWRFGKKHFQLDADHPGGSIYIDSNTTGIISFQATDVYLGELRSHTVADITMFPLLVGPAVSDGDMLESLHIMSGVHGYTKCLAMDISGVPSALLTRTPSVGTIALGVRVSISSGITLSGGSCGHMIVNAGDSVVSGMEITLLDINIAKNVIFIGCTIGAYADLAAAPNTNEYQFIGCTIGGIPANTFLALTDTPMAYVAAGDMLVTNTTTDGLEFATVAQQDWTDPANPVFSYARQDMINGGRTPTWDQPAPLEIHDSTKDPIGFESIANCSITYLVRVLTLTFTGDTVIWLHGKRHKFTNGHSFVWADHTDNTNTYFMYLQDDGAGGLETAMCAAPAFWDLSAVVPVSYVLYKDTGDGGPDGFANEERHGNTWPWAVHRDLHLQRGAWTPSGFEASGYLVGGEAIANKKVTLAEGVVVDEDLWNTVTTFIPGNYVHFWVNSTNDWTWATGNSFPVPYTASGVPATQNPKYNELGVGLTEVVLNNRWFNTYILATNSLDPVFRFVVIVGQQVYTSLAAAQGESIGALNLGNSGEFPFQESVALYQITWRRGPYDLGLALNPYARIDALTRIVGERITVAGIASTSHATLTNRDAANCHPATAIGYDNAASELGSVDVQTVIDEIVGHYESELGFVSAPGDAWETATHYYSYKLRPSHIVMVQIDVIGTVVVDVGGGAANGDAFHRRFTLLLKQVPGGGMFVPPSMVTVASDETIFYEDPLFEDARLNPGTRLDVATDYVQIVDGALYPAIQLSAIKFGGLSTDSTTRYSVRFNIVDDVEYAV